MGKSLKWEKVQWGDVKWGIVLGGEMSSGEKSGGEKSGGEESCHHRIQFFRKLSCSVSFHTHYLKTLTLTNTTDLLLME